MQLEEKHKNRNLDSTPNNLRTKKKEKKKKVGTAVQELYDKGKKRDKEAIRTPI